MLALYHLQQEVLAKAIVSVTNDLLTDQRVSRTCDLLHHLGYKVVLVGRKKKGSTPLPKRKYHMYRFSLPFEKGFLFYAFYNMRLFFFLMFNKAHLLVSNDLDTLFPNFLIHKIKGTPLVYDSHEYFTGVPEIQHRPFVKNIWKTIERFCFPKLKYIFTVNNSIASLYKTQYAKPVEVVRNLPDISSSNAFKDRHTLGLPTEKKIVVLQGAGINIDRGAEEALLAMQTKFGLSQAVLYIIGDGDALPVLKEIKESYNLEGKVFFLPRMPYSELMHYTANADLGLTLDKDTNENYRFSLPNKLFDYIHAQVPILASDLVEVRKIITQYHIGMISHSHAPDHLAGLMQQMLFDTKMRAVWKKNLKIAAKELNWNNEKKTLENVFRKFI